MSRPPQEPYVTLREILAPLPEALGAGRPSGEAVIVSVTGPVRLAPLGSGWDGAVDLCGGPRTDAEITGRLAGGQTVVCALAELAAGHLHGARPADRARHLHRLAAGHEAFCVGLTPFGMTIAREPGIAGLQVTLHEPDRRRVRFHGPDRLGEEREWSVPVHRPASFAPPARGQSLAQALGGGR